MADKKAANTRDGLALIVGGLFVLALVFAAYNYFNRGGNDASDTTQNEDNVSLIDRIKDLTTKSNDEGIDGDGMKDQRMDDSTATGTGGPTTTWQANDYHKGDISTGKYTVKSGDTLWEIAEAVYGNGAQWTQLLAANSSDIGFLPSGQQALIVPGQVLIIPTMN